MSASSWEQVTQSRKAVRAFVLPLPESVGRIEASMDVGDRWQTLAATARTATQRGDLAQLTGMLPTLPPESLVEPIDLHAFDCHAAPDPHDAFFRIARIQHADAAAYLRGVVEALALFLDEALADDERHDYACIAAALAELCSTAFEEPAPAVRSAQAAPGSQRQTPTMKMRAADPIRRWLRGHQVFAALTQGLIWTLRSFQRSSAAGRQADMQAALQRVARLYRASAAAFRFSADFDPAVYADVIRPSMCEPHVPKGFSGSLSSDHGVLVRLLADLRDPLAAARQHFPAEYDDMRAALVEIYDDHIWVCARFNGGVLPSLRTRAVDGEHSAVDMLDRFKTRRVSMLN